MIRARFALVLAPTLLACNAVLGNDLGVLGTDDAGADAAFDAMVPPNKDAAAPLPDVVAQDVAPPLEDAGAGCVSGQKLCFGSCSPMNDPLLGCASSGCAPCVMAHATSACAGGSCAIGACQAGYADCDGNPANGCETDLSQAAHCGACNAVCPTTAPVCAPSGGGFACATGCPSQAPSLCGSQCVDLTSSATHCGGCNTVCNVPSNGVATCAQSQCGFRCNAGFHACGSSCVSDSDPATCGGSCTPCAAPDAGQASCTGGQCGLACGGGTHLCGRTCASNTSPASCGASCGACPTGPNATATCNGMACGITCAAGFGDCNANPADGCEAALATDNANCGRCGGACTMGQSCVNGMCASPPDAGGEGGG